MKLLVLSRNLEVYPRIRLVVITRLIQVTSLVMLKLSIRLHYHLVKNKNQTP